MNTKSLSQLRDRRLVDPFFDRFFDGFFSEGGFDSHLPQSFNFVPTVDLEENDESYLMAFDLPGIDKKDIKIEINDNYLVVSGERKSENR